MLLNIMCTVTIREDKTIREGTQSRLQNRRTKRNTGT